MSKKIIAYTMVFLMAMSFGSINVLADEFGSVPVDISNDYIDSEPVVWNTYVVWTRGLDLDVGGTITVDEPSWIMVYNTISEEAWNITPHVGAGFLGGSSYYHAQNPDIYGDKIVYQYQRSVTSDDTGLSMYNITNNETWVVPIPMTFTSGGLQKIYGDWIFSTHYGTYRIGVIYNYKTGEYYEVSDIHRPSTGIGAISMNGKYVTWTENFYSGVVLQTQAVMIFNLDNLKSIQLYADDKVGNPTRLRTPSVYYETIIFSILDTTPTLSYNLYSFDLSTVNWSAISGNIHAPTTLLWANMEGNITEVSVDFTNDTVSSSIWINSVYYQKSTESGKIYKYDIRTNSTITILDIPYTVYLGDIHYDKVVWSDDRAGEFNIYRLTTNMESFSDILILSIPVIFIGIVIALFWKAFSGGLGGMS